MSMALGAKVRIATRSAAALLAASCGCLPMEDLSSYASSEPRQAPAAAERALEPGDSLDAGLDPDPPVPAEEPRARAPGPSAEAADAALSPVTPPPGPNPSASGDAGSAAATATRDAAASERGGARIVLRDGGASIATLPGAFSGATRRQVRVDGVVRSFIYYAPAALDPDAPAPVLIVAHGFTQTAADMFDITRFDVIADREGFVVLYPDGQGRVPWNIGEDVCPAIGRPVLTATGDDSALVDAMLAFVAADRRVDTAHVFVAGLASGAYLANQLGCERPDIRAVVAHSGGSHALAACASARKPVLALHGLADPVVSATCSAEARDRWVEHDGCGPDVDTRAVLGGRCEVSRGCPADGQVVLCTFDGMGQGWAGGSAEDASFLSYASASELSWEFFTTYAW